MTQIHALSEGTFTVGRDKVFYAFDEENEQLNDRSIGSLLVEVQPFVIVNERDIILLDTGLGFNIPGGGHQLSENLFALGIQPQDVTKVLMSHLHKDHAGGLDPALFSQADIYVYRPEYGFAMETGFPSYYTEELLALEQCDRVHWLEGERGTIDGYIHFEHTGGHSPQHVVYKIESEEGTIFFGGDEAPQYKQMKMKYVAKYDFDGKKAMELRAKWAEEGAREGWRFLFYHDVKMPLSKIS